jgi:predicted transcriptional regulator
VEWRRRQLFELSSKGQSQTEIARTLQISESTISRDLDYLREQAKTNIKRYIDERLPEEYEKCLVGLNTITKEAWNTANQTEDRREKIQALSLAKECYSIPPKFALKKLEGIIANKITVYIFSFHQSKIDMAMKATIFIFAIAVISITCLTQQITFAQIPGILDSNSNNPSENTPSGSATNNTYRRETQCKCER